ncbi:disulfide-isomerase-like protein EhSep2 [Seminavis robusta]|uniref:Disulfide-isomerase-like protein EhSep2 n=1 Tax=Seminavis robusta TaxID=568900 RepID=A0A9N8EL90_9STRA|nr:disulfide-isomerase-like protein EhSep2 [Seminavis robusta]|eukprot:Sro1186_g250390.1 disulfide-isomerase-like protein EhSep2 (173) ;mRNA; f:27650-28168
MKPDWDKLAKQFAGSDSQLIADVDCTEDGEDLCEQHGIEGFPTLKWGDPADLQDYEGGRDYASLLAFADENLKPQCSPANIDLCDDEKKAEIAKYMAMKVEDLEEQIEEKEEALAKIDSDFEQFIEGLQKSYEEMMEKNQEEKEAIKKSGLGLMKAVRAAMAAKEGGGKDEL